MAAKLYLVRETASARGPHLWLRRRALDLCGGRPHRRQARAVRLLVSRRAGPRALAAPQPDPPTRWRRVAVSSEAGIHIEVASGVSAFTGDGFCSMVVRDGGCAGKLLGSGQDTPAGIRAMALAWLEAAEAAESDAVVFGELRAIGLDEAHAGRFIANLRERRS